MMTRFLALALLVGGGVWVSGQNRLLTYTSPQNLLNANPAGINDMVLVRTNVVDTFGKFYYYCSGCTNATNADLSVMMPTNSIGRWVQIEVGVGGTNSGGDSLWFDVAGIATLTNSMEGAEISHNVANGDDSDVYLELYATTDGAFTNYAGIYAIANTNSTQVTLSTDAGGVTTSYLALNSGDGSGFIQLQINGTNEFYVAGGSGYSGTGTLFLSDDGTYKAASSGDVLWNNVATIATLTNTMEGMRFGHDVSLGDDDSIFLDFYSTMTTAAEDYGVIFGTLSTNAASLYVKTAAGNTEVSQVELVSNSAGAQIRMELNGSLTDGFFVDTPSGYTGTGTLYLSDDGTYKLVSSDGIWTNITGNVTMRPGQSATNMLSFVSGVSDNATNILFRLDSANSLSAAGTKYVSINNAGSEVLNISPNSTGAQIVFGPGGTNILLRDVSDLVATNTAGAFRVEDGVGTITLNPDGTSSFVDSPGNSTISIGEGLVISQANNLGTTSPNGAKGFLANNTFLATAGTQQNSAGVAWQGQGYGTNSATSQSVMFGAYVVPTAGLDTPTGQWRMYSVISNTVTTLEAAINSNSGYTGAGTKALFDDGTYKLVSAGATINPTDNYLPVRSNATTFVDSPLYMVGITNIATDGQLYFGPGTTNVLYRYTDSGFLIDDFVFTNSSANARIRLVKSTGAEMRLSFSGSNSHISSSGQLQLEPDSGNHLRMGDNLQWNIFGTTGYLMPTTTNAVDIGSSTIPVKTVYAKQFALEGFGADPGTNWSHGFIRQTSDEGVTGRLEIQSIAVGTNIVPSTVFRSGNQSNLVDIKILGAAAKTLTESSATTVANITLATDKILGGTLRYTIHASDGTDHQSRRGTAWFTAVNKATAVTASITTGTEDITTSAGTLTVTWTIVANGESVDLKANAVSSLTQTSLATFWDIDMHSNGLSTITPQ